LKHGEGILIIEKKDKIKEIKVIINILILVRMKYGLLSQIRPKSLMVIYDK